MSAGASCADLLVAQGVVVRAWDETVGDYRYGVSVRHHLSCSARTGCKATGALEASDLGSPNSPYTYALSHPNTLPREVHVPPRQRENFRNSERGRGDHDHQGSLHQIESRKNGKYLRNRQNDGLEVALGPLPDKAHRIAFLASGQEPKTLTVSRGTRNSRCHRCGGRCSCLQPGTGPTILPGFRAAVTR